MTAAWPTRITTAASMGVAAIVLLVGPLEAQGRRRLPTSDRRAVIIEELRESRVARVTTLQQTVRLAEPQLVGDSIAGRPLGRAPDDDAAVFRAHLGDVLLIERRNLRRSLGWGVALGGLVGYLHARSLETKDKLQPGTTRPNAFYARQFVLLTVGGAAIGSGIGALFPAWELVHARPR